MGLSTETWREGFASKLPSRPYCADDFAFGSYRQPREVALGFRLIQYNEPAAKRWMLFDLDYRDAAEAYEAANVAVPNIIMENPANGHAHLAYELAEPVTYYDKSHDLPMAYLRDTERAMVRRLGADKAYGGMLAKNAAHQAWRVYRLREASYSIGDIARWLEPHEMKGWAPCERESGLGRNVSLFDELRKFAYGEVRRFKSDGLTVSQFRDRLLKVACGMNLTLDFNSPLHTSEVAGIVKSVARWTWKRFSQERFSEIQRKRINKRWAGHVSLNESKPWEAEGISRATWFRRQNAQNLQNGRSCSETVPYQDNRGMAGASCKLILPGNPGLLTANGLIGPASALPHHQHHDRAERLSLFTQNARMERAAA